MFTKRLFLSDIVPQAAQMRICEHFAVIIRPPHRRGASGRSLDKRARFTAAHEDRLL